MKSFLKSFIFVVCAFALSGCFVPSEADMVVEINADGTYKSTFNGNVTEVNLLDGLKSGEMSETHPFFKRVVYGVEDEGGKVTYLGKALYNLKSERSGNLGVGVSLPARSIDFVSVLNQPNVVILRSSAVSDNEVMELKKNNVLVKGTLCVKPVGFKYVESNAQTQNNGCHLWTIRNYEDLTKVAQIRMYR